MNQLVTSLVTTPLGEIILASDGEALCGAWFAGQKYLKDLADCPRQKDGVLEKAASELELYFAGKLKTFSIPLRPAGTPFQQKVWAGLEKIPYGKVSSYGELAASLGSAPRPIGTATGRNPISIIIPCHRLVGADGSLTGYAGGLDKKTTLLQLEGIAVRDGKIV